MCKMSYTGSCRMGNKKEDFSDASEGRNKRENFSRLKSIFEIKRPNRPNSNTLRKSKSTSELFISPFQIFEDEQEVNRDRVFVRNNSRYSIRSESKCKKRSVANNLKRNSLKQDVKNNIPEDTKESNTFIEELNTKLKKSPKTEINDIPDIKFSFDKAFVQEYYKLKRKSAANDRGTPDNTPEVENKISSSSEEVSDETKYIKNNFTPRTISLNRDMETRDDRNQLKSFTDADSEAETEKYRKSLVNEMDREVAKMKLDGFIDEDDNFNNNNNEQYTNKKTKETEQHTTTKYNEVDNINSGNYKYNQICDELLSDLDKSMQMIEYESKMTIQLQQRKKGVKKQISNEKQEVLTTQGERLGDKKIIIDTNDESANPSHSKWLTTPVTNTVTFEDALYESLGDDLENGSYFVEAYNDEGRELVIVEISLERRTVNFNKPFPLANISQSIKDADMVFHQRDDNSLNLIEDPRKFVPESIGTIAGETSGPEGPDSNRSTVYSTTSRDSEIFDDDDEGIGMGSVEKKVRTTDEYNNVTRQTFCDQEGIVRIERIGNPETVSNSSLEDLTAPVSRHNSFTQKSKLSYIIEEIKYTEKKYLTDLSKVVKKYSPYIDKHTPANLMGKQFLMFGNIETLYENQKKFAAALETCGEHADDIVKTFLDYRELFKLYPTYFKNKPKADIVIKEFNSVIRMAQERFKEKLDLTAYLLTPLQRLGKYKLFLESIEKQLRKSNLPTEDATAALQMIKKEMSKGNDFVAIETIRNSPLLKTDYGSFKMREIFTIIKPRRFESMVFLFENVVVFTTLGSQRSMEIYTYCDSIKMNDLRIATFEDTTIHLTNFTKGKQMSRADRFTYVLDAKTEKLKDTWRKAIEDILWQQLYKVKENTLKMYQSKSTKRGKLARTRIKSAGASVFYCE